MKAAWTVLCGFVLALVVVSPEGNSTALAQKTRNPFGLADVPNPTGKDVQKYAETAKPGGGPTSPNAESWAKGSTKGQKGSIDGEWNSRWKYTGKDWINQKINTKIQTVGDRVYILFTGPKFTYLIETVRTGNKLVGRWVCVNSPKDNSPCVLLVVDDERIDGVWGPGGGRWDFQRKLK